MPRQILDAQLLLSRVKVIKDAHIAGQNEGDEIDRYANTSVADWLGHLEEEIKSGRFNISK